LAGDHATGLYAHAEAIGHYEAGLEGLDAQGDEVRGTMVRLKLGWALMNMHRLAEAAGQLEAALAASKRLGDRGEQAWVHAALGSLARRRADQATAAAHYEAALTLWPAGHDPAGLTRTILRAAGARVRMGDTEVAAALVERGRAMAQEQADPALQAEALLGASMVVSIQAGSLETSIALLCRAEPLARQSKALRTLWRIYYNLGLSEMEAGELRAAEADLRRAIATADQSGLPGYMAMTCVALAEVCLELGAWNQGHAAALRATGLDAAYTDKGRGLRYWMSGEPERAQAAAQEDMETGRRLHDVSRLLDGGARLADRALQLGRVAEAEEVARELVPLLNEHSIWSYAGQVLAPLGEAVVRAGAMDAPAVLAEAEALVPRQGQHLAMAQVLRARGIHLAGQGDVPGALAALLESARIVRERGARVQLARTLHALAEVARSAGDTATAVEADAERAAIVRSIGPETRALTWAQGVW
jgi:tetratricopeptide (TPR) repeat protein